MTSIDKQKGVTLVFAVLLMSAIMAVSLALSTIIVKEIHLSENIQNSIVSYYGAESGLEDVLYNYYHVNPDDLPESGQVPYHAFGTVSNWSLEKAEQETEVTADLAWEEDVKEVPHYNVTTGQPIDKIQTVRITWSADGDQPEEVEWTLLYWKLEGGEVVLDPEVEGANVVKNVVDASAVINNTITINLQGETGTNPKYLLSLLRLKHVGAGGQGKVVEFSVTAPDPTGEPGDLLPIGQETTLRVSGTALQGSEDVSRALEVTIPVKQQAFGVFDYVLFSDTGIGKEWPMTSPFPPVKPVESELSPLSP